MGQQQLILLVLGVVVVGLAVVVGIETFTTNRRQAAADDLVSNGARIASDAIAWTYKAAPLGGGGGSPLLLTYPKMAYDTNADGDYVSGDGVYSLAATATSVVITGQDATNSAYAVTAVYGPMGDCVVTASNTGSVPTTPTMPGTCAGW